MDNGNQNQLQGVKMKYFYENTSVWGGRILSSNIGGGGGGGEEVECGLEGSTEGHNVFF